MLRVLANARNFIWDTIVQWLTREKETGQPTLSDFERLRYELRPGDVLLVEGRSRVSDIIKVITQSRWTHSMLYIGRLHDVDDPELRKHLQQYYPGNVDQQMIVESLLGKGTIVDSLERYKNENLRICRPRGLTRQDAQKVISYAINQLGCDYNVRQLLDLARFTFPYGILPRRWRSSLFEHNAGRPTKTVCSTMMAEAFARVHFPIQPVMHQDDAGNLKMFHRNTRLITPPDFDYSPFFDIIKYPMMDFDELAVYRKLPWDKTGVHCNDIGDCFDSDPSLVSYLKVAQHDDEQLNTESGEQTPASAAPISQQPSKNQG
jgi:hypothetical protein